MTMTPAEQDTMNKVIAALEPIVAQVAGVAGKEVPYLEDDAIMLLSIAVSAKRIADVLEYWKIYGIEGV